jgi:DNA-binding MarR family transcriptional regulator
MSKRSKDELIEEALTGLRRTLTDQDLFDDLAAERLAVNRTDLRVLDILHQEGPMTAGTLADKCGLSRPALTAAVDRLERVGYVSRARSDVDRREVQIELTAKLETLAAEIWGPFGAEAQAEFSAFTRDELEIVTRFLRQSEILSARHRRRLRSEESPG